MFAEDAVWVDGPNGVHRGAAAVVEELTQQLSMFPGGWMEIDALVAVWLGFAIDEFLAAYESRFGVLVDHEYEM